MMVTIFFKVLFFLMYSLCVVVYSENIIVETVTDVPVEKSSDTVDYPDTSIYSDSLAEEGKVTVDSLTYPDSASANIEKTDSLAAEEKPEEELFKTLPDSIEQLYLIGKSARCPSDMVFVADTAYSFEIMGRKYLKRFKEFCIDRFEFPNLRGRFPEVGVTRHQAARRCAERGKRLCSDVEWTTACATGIERSRFSYGNEYSEEKCNSTLRMAERSGEYVTCRSGHGVFDMSGNVWEWTSGGGVGALGGSHRDGRNTRCNTWRSLNIGYRGETVGFRCCKDPD